MLLKDKTVLSEYPKLLERMNLQKQIDNLIREKFARPDLIVPNTKILAPPLTPHHQRVGTAFHYLFRFIVEKENAHIGSIIKGKWVASRGPIEWLKDYLEKREFKIVKDKFLKAKEEYNKFLIGGAITMELIQSCLLLAQLESYQITGKDNIHFGEFYDDDVTDIFNLSTIIPAKNFIAKRTCILDPTFSSIFPNGYRADLILDDTLIEIKTTKDFKMRYSTFRQLIYYFLKSEDHRKFLKSIGRDKKWPRIKKCAIYFARFGFYFVFNISDLISSPDLKEIFNFIDKNSGRTFSSIYLKGLIKRRKAKSPPKP